MVLVGRDHIRYRTFSLRSNLRPARNVVIDAAAWCGTACVRPSRNAMRLPYQSTSRHLRLSVDVRGGAVRVAGDLDRGSAHHLADALSALRSSPVAMWTLDLQDVSFCDVEGLRLLSRAAALADACGRGLHMTRIPRGLADLMAIFSAPVDGSAFSEGRPATTGFLALAR
jgi:anti-anti-sigma factor